MSMDEIIVEEVRDITQQESALRKKKFDIMTKLGVIKWEDVQAQVITFLEEKRNGNS